MIKKLRYVPGLISLCILPFLFFYYFPAPVKPVVLRLFVPTVKTTSDPVRFSEGMVRKETISKKILSVDLDEDHETNSKKLQLVKIEAQRLKYFYDTSTVLRVTFSPDVTYQEFIYLLNIMLQDHHKRYAWVDDEFFIFGEEPPKQTVLIDVLKHDVIFMDNKQNETNFYLLAKVLQTNKLIIVSFIILIVIPAVCKLTTILSERLKRRFLKLSSATNISYFNQKKWKT